MKSCIIVFLVRSQVDVLKLAIELLLTSIHVFTRTALTIIDILLFFIIHLLTINDVTVIRLAKIVFLIVLHIIKNYIYNEERPLFDLLKLKFIILDTSIKLYA